MVAVKSDTMGPPGQARWVGGAAELILPSHLRLELKSESKSGECVSVCARLLGIRSVQLYSAAQRSTTPVLSKQLQTPKLL